MLEFPKRLEFYNRSVSFAYDIQYDRYHNEYFDCDWHSLQHRFIGIGLDRYHLFNIQSLEYEYVDYQSITLFGIRFDRGIIYQAEQYPEKSA